MFNKTKRGLLAMACVFTMMSSGFSANAMETGDLEGASLLSSRMTGSCGCTMSIVMVSKRNCVRNDDKTHTAEYFVTYRCDHGMEDRSEYIKETHTYGGYDGGRHEGSEHIYVRTCACGDRDELRLLCFGNPGSTGGHAQP